MRKDLIGILLFFFVIFTLVSLLSFNSSDPSWFNPGVYGDVYNLFGMFGAQLAGFLFGLFGIGSLWIPFILAISGYHFFRNFPRRDMIISALGGFVLIMTTSCFFAVWNKTLPFFKGHIPAGGIICEPVKSVFTDYAGYVGSTIIFFLAGLAGFILATGLSLRESLKRLWAILLKAGTYLKKAGPGFSFKKNKTTGIYTKKEPVYNSGPVEEKNTPKPLKNNSKKRKPPAGNNKPAQKENQDAKPHDPDENGYKLPLSGFLDKPGERPVSINSVYLKNQARRLESKLEDFGVKGEVVREIPGPVITTFEYKPAPGIKINKIVNLSDDLALALQALSIRIIAPIPGKPVIGIEIPNKERETVRLKELVESDAFIKSGSKLTICLGKDIEGNPVMAALEKMPHLLIAGATGTGKSVFLNSMICSFLYKSKPDEIKLIMIDPKRIELSLYNGIPHLITPVVTDVKKATNALFWAVAEMERRYELLSQMQVRNINQYNRKIENTENLHDDLKKLPLIVIIIDELADLMMVASRDVEKALMRLAQMARAAGIHLILATQRPSVDVLTGIIKANFPTRLTFQVSSKTDSRTIIDTNGAETLLGNGDMLFLPPGTAKLQRIHGAYISERELIRITEFLKDQGEPEYDSSILEASAKGKKKKGDEDYDEKYDDAVALVTRTRQASISMVQRHLRIGYNRAARIVEMMEKEGIVGPSDGAKPREVLVRGYDDDMP